MDSAAMVGVPHELSFLSGSRTTWQPCWRIMPTIQVAFVKHAMNYEVDKKTVLTQLPQPDKEQGKILEALQIHWPKRKCRQAAVA